MSEHEKTDFLPNSAIDKIEDEKEDNQEKSPPLPCWRRIPGIGIFMIIMKNLVVGASDVVLKKITDISELHMILKIKMF